MWRYYLLKWAWNSKVRDLAVQRSNSVENKTIKEKLDWAIEGVDSLLQDGIK